MKTGSLFPLMPRGKDWLEGVAEEYDVVVVGSGLGGLTAANTLARGGHRVLLCEHHYQFGGLATWFRRPGGHIFDISLHGFPVGMIKSCRRYWTKEIAAKIRPLTGLRFVNPQFSLSTAYDREDFSRQLRESFGQTEETVQAFFRHLYETDFTRDDGTTIGQLFERFFPGRGDLHRFLLEPIAYANGSTLDDPALVYAIVFGNFMRGGIHVFRGGTENLVAEMIAEARCNGVDARKNVSVEKIEIQERKVCGVFLKGFREGKPRFVRCRAVVSNAGILGTIQRLVGEKNFPDEYIQAARQVRLNTTSAQVYLGLRTNTRLPENFGELVFTSEAKDFSTDELCDLHTTSRTFSVYEPHVVRPEDTKARPAIVASLNARWEDWAEMDEPTYLAHKERLCAESVAALEKLLPGISGEVEHIEAGTPRTIRHYTRHRASFGTKYEGLAVSRALPEQIRGLYHAGSVGIIMSGWLGAINYGTLVARQVDAALAPASAPAS